MGAFSPAVQLLGCDQEVVVFMTQVAGLIVTNAARESLCYSSLEEDDTKHI